MYVAESKKIYKTCSQIKCSEDIVKHIQELEKEAKEHFVGIYLSASNRILHKETISVGIANQSLVHPREVFGPAFKIDGVVSIIVAHNHPSGELKASIEDIRVTERLKEAGKILGIELLDHIIIVEGGYLSLKNEDIL